MDGLEGRLIDPQGGRDVERHHAQAGHVVRAAGLSIHFEADDLFVLAHIEGFGSVVEAEMALADGPTLSFDGGWVSVACPGRAPRRLCPSAGDECGRWPADADRDSPEDYRAAQLSIPEFLAALTASHAFRPTWFGMVEYEIDPGGRFKDVIRSASGGIGRPERR